MGCQGGASVSRRFRPGQPGFLRLFDSGRVVVWVRPTPDRQRVDVVGYWADLALTRRQGPWVARVTLPAGHKILVEVMDKPHRLWWLDPDRHPDEPHPLDAQPGPPLRHRHRRQGRQLRGPLRARSRVLPPRRIRDLLGVTDWGPRPVKLGRRARIERWMR